MSFLRLAESNGCGACEKEKAKTLESQAALDWIPEGGMRCLSLQTFVIGRSGTEASADIPAPRRGFKRKQDYRVVHQ